LGNKPRIAISNNNYNFEDVFNIREGRYVPLVIVGTDCHIKDKREVDFNDAYQEVRSK